MIHESIEYRGICGVSAPSRSVFHAVRRTMPRLTLANIR